mgnify:CR=1 FL=1
MPWQKQSQSRTQARWTNGDYSIIGQLRGGDVEPDAITYVLFYGKTTNKTYAEALGGYTDPAEARRAAEEHALLHKR